MLYLGFKSSLCCRESSNPLIIPIHTAVALLYVGISSSGTAVRSQTYRPRVRPTPGGGPRDLLIWGEADNGKCSGDTAETLEGKRTSLRGYQHLSAYLSLFLKTDTCPSHIWVNNICNIQTWFECCFGCFGWVRARGGQSVSAPHAAEGNWFKHGSWRAVAGNAELPSEGSCQNINTLEATQSRGGRLQGQTGMRAGMSRASVAF